MESTTGVPQLCLPKRTIRDRMEVLTDLVRTGSILDLGVVDSRRQKETPEARFERKPNFLFRQIAELNSDLLGVDIDAEGVEVMKGMGYDVVCADVETMDLGRTFDVIVAGEIIEHLENPGRFLRTAREHVRPGGVIVISTPNPFYVKQRHKIWRYGAPAVHDEHTCWHDPITLDQLLRRTGWTPREAWWIQPEQQLVKTWSRLLRGYFAHSFMMSAG